MFYAFMQDIILALGKNNAVIHLTLMASKAKLLDQVNADLAALNGEIQKAGQ